MKILTGIDIVNIQRIKEAVEKHGKLDFKNKFINRIFSHKELQHIMDRQNPYPGIAGRFAAKEAVIKSTSSICKLTVLKEIIIYDDIPKVKLHTPIVLKNNTILQDEQISISISHEHEYAVAVCNILI